MTLLRTVPRSLLPLLPFVMVWTLAGCAGTTDRSNATAEPPPPEPDGSSLVLFLQRDGSEAARAIEDSFLPTVETIGREFGSAVVVVDAREGAPEEIAATPLLVYQNHLGRSIYVGRFTTPDRIRSFVRTAQRIPASDTRMVREDVAVKQVGRARIVAPDKITDLAGTPPFSLEAGRFRDEARAALIDGMDGFERVDRIELTRSDRSVYVDVYPYRSSEGWLYLSGAAFSQFHCHEPRWRFDGENLAGRWDERTELFTEAGRRFAEQIEWILGETGGEDVYRPLAATTPVRSWDDLGLPLPPAPPNAAPAIGSGELPRAWTLAPVDDPAALPPVGFRFPAPLDTYSGDARGVRGTLTLGGEESFTGAFTVATSSVTMGEPDLDAYIHGAQVLQVADHPEASFTVERGTAIGGVEWGKSTPITVEGRFAMRGESLVVGATGSLTPDLDRSGEPRLRLEATFEVPIYETFGFRGPDGPDASRNRLIFQIDADLRPRP